jgi:hypothetical protein
MAKLDFPNFQKHLAAFDFPRLFVDVLGWNQAPASGRAWQDDRSAHHAFARRMVAELGGVVVMQVVTADGWPDEAVRSAIWKHLSQQHAENILIFTDQRKDASQSQWYWVKRGRDEATGKPKLTPRRHDYFRGQPVDLFASKLQAMVVELSELDASGRMPVLEAARRIQAALDVDKTTKKFFGRYSEQHAKLLEQIEGIPDDRDRRWYASVILNRLMFVWFLQKKFFLDGGNTDYLLTQLAESRQRGPDRFFGEFLNALFFEAFAKPEADRSPAARQLTGTVPYLNGGLFLHHKLELDADHRPRLGTTLRIPDAAFEGVFDVFAAFTWHLDDTPGGDADEINPDVLGYIFEKYINQKAFGAYYTRPEITGYLAERSIHQLILERVHEPALPELGLPEIKFDDVSDLLARMDARTALKLVNEVLPSITVLDPAVGSGAFLVAALKCLINVYYAVVGRAELGASAELQAWLRHIQASHPSVGYYIKRRIVTDNLYGVDIMEEASEIAKLRLFLAMVSSVRRVEDLEPLPNIDFNILAGNSLVGLMRVDEHEFDGKHRIDDLFRKSFRDLLKEKNDKLALYRAAADTMGSSFNLRELRDDIDTAMAEANGIMNELLQDQFASRGIQFEQATWDAAKGALGKPKKRKVELSDVAAQHPLHWGYVFDDIVQKRGGFDIILANPPWEVFKPQAKEFFADHSDLVSKNKMTIKEFEKEQSKLLKDKAVREAWLAYESRFPHMNQYFRLAPEYRHQFATVDGRKVGSDLNLYKLFVERCFTLLRPGGHCGIVIPSGIYTDLGAKGLRDLLFEHTHIQGLFCFENRKMIFEGVDSRFKFIVLTFEKTSAPRLQTVGESNASVPPDDLLAPTRTGALGTTRFPAAFMRHDVTDLERFPAEGAMWLDVETILKLSPEAHAVMEFKSPLDVQVAHQLLRQPLLGEALASTWKLSLEREFHMTDDSKELFESAPAPNRFPLWEGKQLHQFNADFGAPRYWIDEGKARAALLSPRLRTLARRFKALGIEGEPDPAGVSLNHTSYRIAFRDVARNTDERTMIATVLPPNRYCPHTVSLEQVYSDEVQGGTNISVHSLDTSQRLFVTAAFNSFVFDWFIRQSVTAHVSFFFVYNTPMPRLPDGDPRLVRIVTRAAGLICITPEFDALAKEVGLRDHRDGASDPAERARLRAELDGLVAHLYGLSEAEFTHILGTFPLVPDPVKTAAQNAYRDVERGLIK